MATLETKIKRLVEKAVDEATETRVAYAVVIDHERGGFTLGIAKEGEKGYHPFTRAACHPTYESALAVAEELNKQLGLTPREAMLIVASTMGGEGRRRKKRTVIGTPRGGE